MSCHSVPLWFAVLIKHSCSFLLSLQEEWWAISTFHHWSFHTDSSAWHLQSDTFYNGLRILRHSSWSCSRVSLLSSNGCSEASMKLSVPHNTIKRVILRAVTLHNRNDTRVPNCLAIIPGFAYLCLMMFKIIVCVTFWSDVTNKTKRDAITFFSMAASFVQVLRVLHHRVEHISIHFTAFIGFIERKRITYFPSQLCMQNFRARHLLKYFFPDWGQLILLPFWAWIPNEASSGIATGNFN